MSSPAASQSDDAGEDIRMHGDTNEHDSSEEEEDDEEEAARVRAGFIVDEDEDEEDDGLDSEEKRRKRRKHRKRKRAQVDLDQDDLELLMENSGARRPLDDGSDRKRHKRRDSLDSLDGPPALDDMFNEPTTSRNGRMDEVEEDDMDDFIEEDEDEEMDEETRAELRRQKKEAKRANAKKVRSYAGADQETRAELEDIFGAGDEYAEALNIDEKATKKQGITMHDIFEPTELADRFLLPIDQRIREEDLPERFQFSSSTLSTNPVHAEKVDFPPIEPAVSWIAPRISTQASMAFQGLRANDSRDANTIRTEFEAAVSAALSGMFEEGLEVPYLARHRQDLFVDASGRFRLLNREELWMCYDLGLRYRAIHQKRAAVARLYDSMKEFDSTFVDENFEVKVLGVPDGTASDSIEAGNEALEWLDLRYPQLVQAVREREGQILDRKRAGGAAARRIKHEGVIGTFVERLGKPSDIATWVQERNDQAEVSTPDEFPADLAERFVDETYTTTADVLKAARRLLVQEFGCDPLLRTIVRNHVKSSAQISCVPTPKGQAKIDELHMYYRFKYLKQKPVSQILQDKLFTQMLAAETEGLITIHLDIPEITHTNTFRQIMHVWDSSLPDGNEITEAWSNFKTGVIEDALDTLLIPKAQEWLKDDMKQSSEDDICQQCQDELEKRVDMRPYGSKNGSSVSVLAISFGSGGKDAVMAVFLDAKGHLNAQAKFDGLGATEDSAAFTTFVEENKPDVVVIGGFTAETHRLRIETDGILKNIAAQEAGQSGVSQGMSGFAEHEYMDALSQRQIPLIYVHDEVARLYMNSARAIQENPAWPANARYALGLARFTQDPLNEFCALGSDLVAVTYVPKLQALVSQERLLQCLERALVNVVNAVGVDINQAVKDPYLQKLLPFVAGLGPRKAEALIKSIIKDGGVLANRSALLEQEHLPVTLMINVASALYIPHGQLYENDIPDKADDPMAIDPLDHTRIHPSEYPIAHELVQNVLGLDPEDWERRNPAKAVAMLWSDDNVERKLASLDLEAFSLELARRTGKSSQLLVRMIARELIEPYQDTRGPFALPNEYDVLRMLTGETLETLGEGKIVTAHVTQVKPEVAYIRLDSGVTGEVPREYIVDPPAMCDDAKSALNKSQAVRGVVIKLRATDLYIELSIRRSDVHQAADQQLIDNRDAYFDIQQERSDQLVQAKQKRVREAGLPRVIDHFAWKHVNKTQAESMLKDKLVGDAIIRPSSKGVDHIAVTWKVAEGVFQHINVLEFDKPSDQELGARLHIEGGGDYADLDDLLFNHVGAIVKKMDTLQGHEKYRPENQLDDWLSNQVQARPGSSAYGFSLDSEHPGWVKLSFLSRSLKAGGVVQTWPVKITPTAYKLFDTDLVGMTELCNAFKKQYQNTLQSQKQNPQTPRAPNMTPYGGRTPGGSRTPGGARTPGGGVRPPGMGGTPQVFAGAATPVVRPPGMGTPVMAQPWGAGTPSVRPHFGGATPMFRPPGMGTPTNRPPMQYAVATPNPYGTNPYGAMPPPGTAPPPPPPPPGFRPPVASGMNPERARMIAQQSQGYQR